MKLSAVVIGFVSYVPLGVFGAACTAAQLKGDFNSFRTTGGGGAYFAGTEQIVSYDRPANTTVTSLTGVTIVPFGANTPVFNPTILSGAPVNFSSSAPDTAGTVDLILPANLSAGAFVFRLSLISGGAACFLDSAAFTSLGAPTNQCALNTSQCLSTTQFVTCVNATNGNHIFGPPQNCQAGTSCVQTGSQAICSSSIPQKCTPGNSQCSGTGFKICFEGLTGPQFTDVLPCGPGTACVQNGNSISCALSTIPPDECSEGRCVTASTFQSCVTGPQGNKIFAPIDKCGAGTSCTGAGLCTSTVPVNCTSGFMRCSGSTSFETCVNGSFDAKQNCPLGTTCNVYQTNYIICM